MGHAMYIGRVGALAVALGVGAAVATGYGSPAVAWAEDGSESSQNTPDTSADPADDRSSESIDTSDSTPKSTAPEADSVEAEEPDPTTDSDPTVPQTQFADTVDEPLSGDGEDGTDPGTATPQPPTQTETPPTPPAPQPTVTPPSTALTDPEVVTPSASVPGGPQAGSADNAPTEPAITAGVLIEDANDLTSFDGPSTERSSRQEPMTRALTAAGVGDPTAAPQSLLAATTAPVAAGPAPLRRQPANLIEAVLGAPVVLVNIAVTAINMFLTSIFAPGPTTPAPPTMLFVVLGWVQRELRRSFFNQSPTAVNDDVTTAEDTDLAIAVLANDTDADLGDGDGDGDGDVLTVTDYTQPVNGSVVLNPAGTFTYTPAANYTGTDTFTYTVSDEAGPWHLHRMTGLFGQGGHTSTTTVTVTVTAVDDAPVAVDDIAAAIAEDGGPTVIDVLANDTDIDGGPEIIAVTQPAHGTATFNATAVSYTPAVNYNGTDTFTYTLNGGSTATVSVSVTPVDDAPIAVGDTYTVTEDTPRTFTAAELAGNDTDPDTGDVLHVAAVNATANTRGTVVLNPNGTLTYTPALNYTGAADFTYTISDGQLTSTVATVSLIVTAVNDAPIAVDDTYTVTEDTTLTVAVPNVLSNDSDLEGNSLTAELAAGPSHGALTLNTDGSFTYTPAANYHGPDSFTYTVTDGSLDSTVATVNLTVTAVNDAPVIGQVTSTPGVGNTWVVSVNGSSDIDGDALTTTVASADATIPLTVTQLPGGGFQVVADPDWARAHPGAQLPVTLTVTDGQGGSVAVTRDIGTVNNVTAVGLNNAGQLNIPALPAGLTYSEVGAGRLHTVLLRSDGTAVAVGFNFYGQLDIPPLPEGVTYTKVFDSDGGADYTVLLRSDGTAVTVGGPAIPAPPDGVRYTRVAASVTHTVLLLSDGTAVTIGGPAIPELPDGVTYTQVAAGGSGNAGYHTVLLRSDGTAVGVGSNSSGQINIPGLPAGVRYTRVAAGLFGNTVLLRSDGTAVGVGQTFGGLLNIPAPPAGVSYTQVDVAINYTVLLRSDGTVIGVGGDFSDSGGENIPTLPAGVTYTQVAAGVGHTVLMSSTTAALVNAPPVANNDTAIVAEGASTTIALTANDADADINAATVVITGQPTAGSVTVNPDGTITYASNGTEVTSDSFNYRINDSNGATSNEATVSITITPVNDAPTAPNQVFTTPEDTPVNFDILTGASDVDGGGIYFGGFAQQPANGSLYHPGPPSLWTYTPSPNFTGQDTIQYRIQNADGATSVITVTITVTPNDPPVAVNDTATVGQGNTATIALTANDTDTDGTIDPATIVITQQPTAGTVTANPNGTATYVSDGTILTPDSFTYTVKDNTGATSNPATVTINIINERPVAADQFISILEDTSVSIDPLAGATDAENNVLQWGRTQFPAVGEIDMDYRNGLWSIIYTPPANYSGQATFYYGLIQGVGGEPNVPYGESNDANIYITVIPVNDAPVANIDTATVAQGGTTTIALTANDTDVDDPINATTVAITQQPTAGSVTVNPNGTVSYTSDGSAVTTDSFTYRVNDNTGATSNEATVTVTITAVNPVNVAPTATDDVYNINEDTPLVITGAGVLGNDTDPESNPLTAVKVTDPTNGTVTLNANGSFTYTPAANYNGPDSFTYKANDGALNSTVATVTVTVNPVNDAPIGNPDAYTLAEDTTLTVDAPGLLGNDTDADGQQLVITAGTAPLHGAFQLLSGGGFTYTPTANYNGPDSFTYRMSDGIVTTAPIMVNITVTPVDDDNDAPVGNPDAYTLAEDGTLTIPAPGVLGNDTDADGQPLFITAGTAPSHGTFELLSNGSFAYTPAPNYNGPDSFTYQASDGIDTTVPVTVNITVTPVNDAPVVESDTIPFPKNGFIGFSLQNRSSDVDNDTLTATLISGTQNGTLFFDGVQRVFSYQPNTDFVGQDSFTYKVNDGTVDSAIATVTLNVS